MNRPFVQSPPANARLARWLPHAATALGVIVALVGGVNLVAWLSGYMAQRGFNSVTMKTNTALCLLLLGVGLVLLVPSQAGSVRRGSGRGLAGLAALIGLLSLGENLFGWNLGIDQLLAQEPPGAFGVAGPNLMGTPAATGFLLAGLALLILSRGDGRGTWAAQGLALGVCIIALLGTIGFLYGIQSLHTIVRVTGIAWPTAASLLALGLGLLLARPAQGLMAQVTADDPGGANLRRWLPVLLLPVLLGWLRLAGERWGLFDAAMGTALMMIIFMIALAVLAYTGAGPVSRSSSALRQQREWLRVTLTSIGDAVLATDATGKITFLNPVAEALTGWKEQDVRGRPAQEVFRIINEQTREQADDIVARVLREGFIVALANHTAILTRDGREIPIEDSAAPIKDADGRTTGVVLVFHDVTQRRRAEEELDRHRQHLEELVQERTAALRKSQALLNETQRITKVGGWEFDVATGRALWTDEVYRIHGVSMDFVPGPDQSIQFYAPQDQTRISDAFALAVTDGKPYDLELQLTTAQGQQLWVRTMGQAERKDGRVVRVVGNIMDITDRKRAEDALRVSEQEFRSLAEAMPQIVWATRPDGWNIYFNQQWVDYTGMTMEESHGHGWNTPFHPDDKQHAWEAWQRATQHNERYSLECRLRRADGVYRWWLIRGSPMLGANGEILKWFGTCTDIEDLKHAEAALREANDLLEQRVAERTAELTRSNRELEQFAYISAHDLQEPLRQVRAYVGLLKERHSDRLDAKAEQYLGFVYDGAARMSDLVAGLLAYSRAGAREAMHEPVSCKAALDAAMANLQVSIDEAHARITHDDLPTVTAEPMQLTLLFQNLASNAIKFRRDGVTPEIHVGCRREGEAWLFSVADNGIGVPKDVHDRIFVIFQRLHTRQQYPGTGIGLAICKKIVERHGGRIWVESTPGEGSTFYFTLPAACTA